MLGCYMSNEQADAIYGRLCREIGILGREIALFEAEFKNIGQLLEATGKQIQGFNLGALDRTYTETSLGQFWDMREKYLKAVAEHADKKRQKEAIDASN